MQCKLCGKERKIVKFGCCNSCYMYNVKKIYSLKEDAKFIVTSQQELIQEFLENQKISKKELAKKYCITERDVYYAIKRFCDVHYVKRDDESFILN